MGLNGGPNFRTFKEECIILNAKNLESWSAMVRAGQNID